MLTPPRKLIRPDVVIVGPEPLSPPPAPVVADLREVTESNDPGSANLSQKGGKAKMSYWWTSTAAGDFVKVAALVLGWSTADPNPTGTGAKAGVLRQPPLAHPRFPSLYAETISDFTGVGGKFVKEAAAPPISAPTFPQYSRYPQYRIDVEFASRMYYVDPDSSLTVSPLTWHEDNGSGADVTLKCWDTQEYLRWCWIQGGPKENWVTGKSGQLALERYNPQTGAMQSPPLVFTDQIKMALPDGAVVIHWFEVPYSFVRPLVPVSGASWFQLYQGRVNQFAFPQTNPIWQAGELLYVTIAPKPYTSPIPDSGGNLITLCDVDIICLETKRLKVVNDVYTAPALQNWLQTGWNLQPFWMDRGGFHYVHVNQGISGTTLPANQQPPIFRSFPFQILFSNPEVTLPP